MSELVDGCMTDLLMVPENLVHGLENVQLTFLCLSKGAEQIVKPETSNKMDFREILCRWARGVECRSGQVWGHTPEQRVAVSTLRRHSFGLRLAIAQADVRPAMPVSFR